MALRKRDIGLGGAVGVVLVGHVVVVWVGAAAAVRWLGGIAAVALVVVLIVSHVIGVRRLVARRRTAAARQARSGPAERGPAKAQQ